jgi:hypothetical protein
MTSEQAKKLGYEQGGIAISTCKFTYDLAKDDEWNLNVLISSAHRMVQPLMDQDRKAIVAYDNGSSRAMSDGAAARLQAEKSKEQVAFHIEVEDAAIARQRQDRV